MKKFKKILFLIAAFIGAFGYQLVAANTYVMNYEKELDAMSNMLGIEIETDENGELNDPVVELEGIGRIVRGKSFDPRSIVKKLDRARASLRRQELYQNVSSVITPTQRYIYGVKPRLDSNTQKRIENKELEYTDAFIYYTKGYTNISGNNLIIHSNDTIGVGYSNLLENGIVPSEMIMAATFFGLETNAYDTATQNIFNGIFASGYQKAGFRNAEIELLINGKVTVSVPVFLMRESRIFKGAQPVNMSLGINLEKPILIKPGDRINFNLRMAEGAAIANTGTLKTGVRVILAGSGTKGK
ncbi:MAG: hypothetical protein L3J35_03685 [Bacteroidales bacterium]|nr:hypothetical protein [Bacteroidales bacterium]